MSARSRTIPGITALLRELSARSGASRMTVWRWYRGETARMLPVTRTAIEAAAAAMGGVPRLPPRHRRRA